MSEEPPNGAGKSSLLSAVAHTGITARGEIRYGAENLRRMAARRRAEVLALLAQDSGTPGELRVRELVAIGARAASRSVDPMSPLSELGIADLAERRVGTLSGGQRQLVQLARVRAQDTPVVLLDEPTSALDLSHQGVVERTVRALAAQGRIVILAVHDLSLALNACTAVLLLDGNGGSHFGSPEQVLRPELVHSVYGVHVSVHRSSSGRSFLAPTDPAHPSAATHDLALASTRIR